MLLLLNVFIATKGVRVICESRPWGYGGIDGGEPSNCVEIKRL
jgi:hypothetical protein